MLPDALEGSRHSCFGAAIDNDLRAFCGECGSDGEANAASSRRPPLFCL